MSKGKEKIRISLIVEVAVFFLIGTILTGLLMYAFETGLSSKSVLKQTERHAAQMADETKQAMMEFPAYPWLVQYWYTHSDEMDIEYDAELNRTARTAEKCRVFSERNPGLQLRYIDEKQCEALSPEDQKLYAEIAYSWLLTRVNQIKKSYHVPYLFCVISGEPYEKQFFLYSGAQPGASRGTGPTDAYVLGTKVSVAETQTYAMSQAAHNSSYIAYAGDVMDFYSLAGSFDDQDVFIGLTYNLSALKADVANKTHTAAKLAILHQIVLSVICLLLIFLFLLLPLKKIQQSIRSYSETKDSSAARAELAEVRPRNELGQLSVDISNLTEEIDTYTTDLMKVTSEKKRIETELDLAAKIQASMLPSIFPPYPDRNEFDIYATMDPAKEVGGDFYDFFLIDEDHLGLVMADVSGKGIPAALFMMASKIVIAQHAKAGKSPAQTLADANEIIAGNNPMDLFVTVWLGVLEISSGKLIAANAGHEYPVLRDPDGDFELIRDKHGFVLGTMEGMKYRDYEMQLEPGAKLYLYTDGVPEATNAEKEMFGTDRMLGALNEVKDQTPMDILHHIRSAVNGFVKDEEPFDDMTMLCLDYSGTEGSGRLL